MARAARLTARSLEQDVYDALREAILAGDRQPGEPLVEAQLSEQFGISKTPVREALIRLKRDGLVESAPHHTNRVATPTAHDVVQAFEVRIWIETQVAMQAAEDPSPELLCELEESIDASEAALKKSREHDYILAIRRFSDVLLAHSGNHYAVDALQRLRNVLGLIASVSRLEPARRKRSIEEHRRILRAIRAKQPDKAAEATREHLRSIEKDSLKALEGQVVSGAEQ